MFSILFVSLLFCCSVCLLLCFCNTEDGWGHPPPFLLRSPCASSFLLESRLQSTSLLTMLQPQHLFSPERVLGSDKKRKENQRTTTTTTRYNSCRSCCCSCCCSSVVLLLLLFHPLLLLHYYAADDAAAGCSSCSSSYYCCCGPTTTKKRLLRIRCC